MTPTRRVAARTVDVLCDLVGRRQLVRAARFALHHARLDVPNAPAHNGEYALQRWVLDMFPPNAPITVLDVGANVGMWTRNLLRQAAQAGRLGQLRLHAFEPASDTHRLLVENLPAAVRVNQLAVSNGCGQTELRLVAPGAGTNSLYDMPGRNLPTESVRTITIDEYVQDNDIGHVDLIKVDTEGHDLAVLNGAERSLHTGAISLIQFEYNHRWVHARCYLKDAFDLLGPLGYQVGKLTPGGMESYPGWDPDLETFVEGNYLAATREVADRLPQVKWWKSP